MFGALGGAGAGLLGAGLLGGGLICTEGWLEGGPTPDEGPNEGGAPPGGGPPDDEGPPESGDQRRGCGFFNNDPTDGTCIYVCEDGVVVEIANPYGGANDNGCLPVVPHP